MIAPVGDDLGRHRNDSDSPATDAATLETVRRALAVATLVASRLRILKQLASMVVGRHAHRGPRESKSPVGAMTDAHPHLDKCQCNGVSAAAG